MDGHLFDLLTRLLSRAPSRRAILHVASAVPALAAIRFAPAVGEAKKKKRRKKPVLNEFGCVSVGGKCRGDSDLCCSGICEGAKPRRGKRDRSRCVAHNVQGCQPEFNNCGGNGDVCGEAGACYRTTGEASFCGNLEAGGTCMVCRKDADCEPIEGVGAACIVCEGLACPETGTSCMPAAV